MIFLSRHICIAIRVDVPRCAKQLYGCLNECRKPQDKQDERSKENDARDQHALGRQHKNEDEKDQGQRGGDDTEREQPMSY